MTGSTAVPGDLAERLAGSEGRAGLAALVDGADTWTAVAAAAGVTPDRPGVPAHRVAWKPDRRLRAFYDVPTPVGVRPVAVRWDAGGGRVVEVWPADASWPHLAEFVGGAAAGEALNSAGWDGSGEIGLDVLRYRPGQRHVVRLRAGRTVVYVKIGAAGTAGHAAASAAVLAGAARAAGALASAASWWSDRLGALAVPAVPGVVRAVAGPSGEPGAGPARDAHLERMGRFLRALHDGAVPDGAVPDGIADAPGPEAEAALTARAWEHAVRLHPDLGPALRNVLDIAIVAAGAAGPRSLLHGDVKIEHLLDAGDRLAVIDLDSVAVGDPLRDVGRLLASLWWEERRWSDERSPGHDRAVTGAGIRGALLAAYDPADRLDRRALGGWTALALLKQAARRVPVLDPGLGAGLAHWLDVASVACSGDVT